MATVDFPKGFTRIVGGKKYSTDAAELIAHDQYWDGNNFDRNGRNVYLYRTPNGRYFTVTLTRWQGERDTLEPISQDEAVYLYEESLSEHEVSYKDAFPHIKVADA